jgi:hypothetical protein
MHHVAGVHAELMVSGNVVTINRLDESNKQRAAKGFSGTVLVVSGSNREIVQLAVAGDNALKCEAKAPMAEGRLRDSCPQERRRQIRSGEVLGTGVDREGLLGPSRPT